jgi:23S rRNA pseudouridine2605 synthase
MVHDPLRPQPDDPGQEPDSAEALGEEGPGERVAKLLARSGVGSRRDVERLIGEGRVAINGRTLTTPAVKVEPNDILTVDGEVVGEPEPARLFRYHKPVGLVTTHKDPAGRPTVFDNLPDGLPRLISVGRLDINSEGLLLLTNDGGLARALEMPSSAVVRRYRARAHGRTTQEKLDRLKDGITVEGVRYGPIEAHLDKAKEGPQGANLWLTVTLHEGKNREVRRVLEAIGLKVNRLIRLAYGPLALGTLGAGELEEVGPRVVREQFAEHIEADNLPTGERPLYRAPRKSASRRAQDEAKTQAELAPVRAPKVKPVYKSGWAKPKPKTRQPLKEKAEAKVRAEAAARPKRKPKAKPTGKAAAAPAGPGIIDRATAVALKASGRKGPGRNAPGPNASGPRPPGPKPSGPKPSGPKAPGSKRAGGPSPGPRGPKPPGSRPGSSPARRPSPRTPGGPTRRG